MASIRWLVACCVLLVGPVSAWASGESVAIDPFDLPAGASVTIEFEVTIDEPVTGGATQVCNQGAVPSADFAGDPIAAIATNDPATGAPLDATCTLLLLQADVEVSKSDSADPVAAGAAYSYTVNVSNLSTTTATGVTVVDTLPAGVGFVSASGTGWSCGFVSPDVTCTRPSLPMGAAPTITVNVTAPAEGGMITNQVTVAANEMDPVAGNNSDSESTTVTPRADISVSKSDGVTSAVPGQQVVYSIVVSNLGPSTDPSVSVADTFPGVLSCGWTSTPAGGATGNTNNAGPANLANTLSMPPSSSVTYTATCAIAPDATGTLSNTAMATASIPDPVAGNDSATDGDTMLTPQANVAVTKTDGVTSAVPGEQIVYTIAVTNNGPSTDPSVSVADTFPGVLSCGWTSTPAGGATGNTNNAGPANLADTLAMPPSSSVTYTATCDIDVDATGTLSNTATAMTSVADPVPGNNSAVDNDTALAPEAELSITKTDGVTSAVPGGQVVYTIVVANAGPSTDPSAAVADTFPGVLSCGWTSVPAGGATGNTNNAGPANLADSLSLPPSSSVTYTVTCDIDPDATGTLSNTATVTASVTDPVPGNDSATDGDTVLAAEADLSVTKTDGVTSAVPGQQVVYTIVASNAGPSTDPSVAVADTFPGVLTCGWTSIAAGGATGNTNNAGPANLADTLSLPPSSSVTYTVTCDIAPDASGTLSNTATVTASVDDPVAGNDSATDGDTVLAAEADLSVTKTDGVTSAVPGQQVVYTIVASNAGPSTDPSVAVADTFPGVLTCGWTSIAAGGATGNTNNAGPANLADTLSLPPLSSVTYTVTCAIAPDATGTLSNTATVTASATDPMAGNDSATDGDTVLSPQADLAVTKTDGVTSAVPGQQVVYTIVASNAGPSTDPSAQVADTFPGVLSCGWTSIAAGGATGNTNNAGPANLADTLSLPPSASVTYTVTCDIAPDATGTLSNTATVTASVSDANAANDSATDGDTVLGPQADLSLTKTAVPPSGVLGPGDPVTYTIQVTNEGPSTATGVVVTDVLPAGLVFLTTAGDCAEGASAVPTCTLGTLAPGASKSYTIDATVDTPAPSSITNTATVAGNEPDPDPSDDSDDVTHSTDEIPPTVVAVDTDPTSGGLASCDTVSRQVPRLQVTFSEAMQVSGGVPGPDDADSPDNYLLLATGPDLDFSTDACGSIVGDDVAVPVVAVAYAADSPAAPQSTVTLTLGASLASGLYRFLVCGSTSVHDLAGNPLDGDDNGSGGDDFVLDKFRVDVGNLFANGHLDCGLPPFAGGPPAAVQHDALLDVDNSPQSGSAAVPSTSELQVTLDQCVDVSALPAGADLELGGRVRLDASAATLFGLVAACEFSDGAACGGAPLGGTSAAELISGAPGVWGASQTLQLTVPVGAASALCGLGLENPQVATFAAWFDQLFLRRPTLPIFADGFESGDTSAWAATVP